MSLKIKKTKKQRKMEKGDSEMHYQQFTGTPSEMAKVLAKVENCREFLQHQNVDYWIHEYISSSGCSTHTGINTMMYILYALIFVLDELKPLPVEKKRNFLADEESLLTEVTLVAEEEKGWHLDRHAVISLCSKIVEDYVFEKINIESKEFKFDYSLDAENPIIVKWGESNTVIDNQDYIMLINPQLKVSALRQIIRNYPDTALNETYDAVWEWLWDELMVKHDEDEELLHELYDLRDLEERVRKREILPEVYETN